MYKQDRGFEKEARNLAIVIAAANRLRPAFVIVCGDLVNKAGDPSEIAEYLRITRRLNPAIPLYNVAGNHDVGNAPTPESIRAYRKIFGPDYFAFRAHGMEGLVLDTALIKNSSNDPTDARGQEAWLENKLAEAKARHSGRVVVFQHVSWFLKNSKEKNGYFNVPIKLRISYLKLLHRFGVRYVFAGHWHRNSLGSFHGMKVISVGPVGKPLGQDPSGFDLVVVKKNNLRRKYVPLSMAAQIGRPINY